MALFLFILVSLVVSGIICLIIMALLRYKIKTKFWRMGVSAAIGIAITFGGCALWINSIFSGFDYPVFTKKINNDYYFKRQEYGWAFTSTEGTNITIYKSKFL